MMNSREKNMYEILVRIAHTRANANPQGIIYNFPELKIAPKHIREEVKKLLVPHRKMLSGTIYTLNDNDTEGTIIDATTSIDAHTELKEYLTSYNHFHIEMADLYLKLSKAATGYAVVVRAYALDYTVRWADEPVLSYLNAKGYTLRRTKFTERTYIVPIGYNHWDGWRFQAKFILDDLDDLDQ